MWAAAAGVGENTHLVLAPLRHLEAVLQGVHRRPELLQEEAGRFPHRPPVLAHERGHLADGLLRLAVPVQVGHGRGRDLLLVDEGLDRPGDAADDGEDLAEGAEKVRGALREELGEEAGEGGQAPKGRREQRLAERDRVDGEDANPGDRGDALVEGCVGEEGVVRGG